MAVNTIDDEELSDTQKAFLLNWLGKDKEEEESADAEISDTDNTDSQ